MIPRLLNCLVIVVLFTSAVSAQRWTHLHTFQSATNVINKMQYNPEDSLLYCAGYAFDSLLLADSAYYTSNGYADCMIYTTDTSGVITLLHQFGGTGNDVLNDFVFTKKKTLVVTGRFQDAMKIGDTTLDAPGADAFFLAELSADSTPLWSIVGNAFSGNSVALLDNGDILVAGLFKDSLEIVPGEIKKSHGGDDVFIALFDSTGKAKWAHALGCGINDLSPRCFSSGSNLLVSEVFFDTLTFDTAGDTAVSESVYENSLLACYDLSGNLLWKKVFAGSGITQLRHLYIDSTGAVYACGIYSSTMHIDSLSSASNDESSMFFAKLDASGKPLWIKSVDRASANYIIAGEDDDFYLAGSYRMHATFDSISLDARDIEDVFVANYTADGTCKSVVVGGCCRSATASLLAMGGSNLFAAGTVDAVLIHRTCTIDFGGLEVAFNNESEGRTFLAVVDPYAAGKKPQNYLKRFASAKRPVSPARYYDLSGRELPAKVLGNRLAPRSLKTAPAAIIRVEDGKPVKQIRY